MKYQCDTCHKNFLHPAKQTEITGRARIYKSEEEMATRSAPTEDDSLQLEYNVCPFCQTRSYSEFVEPAIPDAKVSAVLVVDLVSGENLAINKALADGYEIVSRYAKAYTLEKKIEAAKP